MALRLGGADATNESQKDGGGVDSKESSPGNGHLMLVSAARLIERASSRNVLDVSGNQGGA